MRRYLLIALLFITATCNAHVSQQQVVQTYKSLIKVLKLKRYPNLILLKTNAIIAGTNGRDLRISTGMLSILQNEDELAGVLAHELSHVIRGDISKSPSKTRELRADELGFQITHNMGYNVCKGIRVMKRMQRDFGDKDDQFHPNWSVRYNNISKRYCNHKI